MSNRIILIVGHGSRVSGAVEQFHQFTQALSNHFAWPIQHCFLELVDPDMATGLSEAAQSAGEGGEVLVLSLFLGAAGHQKNDVATSIQRAKEKFPQVKFHYGTPLAPHAKLIELLDIRVREALATASNALPAEETTVLVVGRGSSDPDSNSEIARNAYLLFEKRPYRSVEYAFQAVAHPRVDEGLRRCKLLGAKQIVIAPYFLFTGKVDQYVKQLSNRLAIELGLSIIPAAYLDVHPLLVEIAVQRVQEMMAGTATMTCDVCKYRWPMAGYEPQVGRPP